MNKYYKWITLSLLTASSLFADVVIFKSGDKLTGKVMQMADGKMDFDSTVAGEITLNMVDIQTFSTDEPITVEKSDGVQIQLKAATGEAGKLSYKEGATSIAIADIAEINPEKPRWKGSVTAGATFARGNTHSDTASADAEAQLRREGDRFSVSAGYRFDKKRDQSTGQDDTTEDKWFIRGKYDYFLNEKLYLYVNSFYEKDRISNLDMRFSVGSGAGYQWIERDDLNFNTEGGPSWVYERYTDPDQSESQIAIRLAYHLDKTLYEKVKAFHNVTFLPSTERSDIYLVYADAGLQTKLIGSWIMELKAELEHDSQPAKDQDKSDYRYILGVGVTF